MMDFLNADPDSVKIESLEGCPENLVDIINGIK